MSESTYTEARQAIRQALNRAEAMRRALEQAMDQPGGMAWEEEIGGPTLPPEPEPTPETTPLMEPPTEAWEKQRLDRLREQMEANWPAKKPWYRRRPWRSNSNR